MIGIGTVRRILEAAWERLFGPDIFITYTRRDGEAYAQALKAALERHYLVFLDDSSIHGGQSISDRIKREIRRSRLHLIVLTPHAADADEAPWIFKEVDLHFSERRRFAMQTIFFPPNAPSHLPEKLRRLADHKGINELPGAERNGSVSIKVLAAIAGRAAPATIDALWVEAERNVPVLPEIRRGFSAVRQRTRIKQAASIALCLLLASAGGSGWANYASRQRLALAQRAEHAEAAERYLDAEQFWLAATRAAPWGRAKFREKWEHARQRRLLTPAAILTLPAGWRAIAIGSRGDGWCVFAHRLHDNDEANGQAALADATGWFAVIPTADDFNPRIHFEHETAYVHAAGNITRIPLATSSAAPFREAPLGFKSYRIASSVPQVALGWKAGKLCVLAGMEHPPVALLLNPATLQTESRFELQLPIDLPAPDTERDGSDHDGEALFQMSVRDETIAVALWRRFTEEVVGVTSWGLDFQPRQAAREFNLPMNEIGPGSSPDLESLELSPDDKQLFLRIGAINFFGGAPRHAGQSFWLALDTASFRPPYLMEPLITEVWPLPTHQRYEAYYRVDGGDLRALTFLEFVVTTRPPTGVLSGVRAANLLQMSDAPEPTLAAASAKDVTLIREAKPIFRIAAPDADQATPERLAHIFTASNGGWLAATFEVQSDSVPQRVIIWKAAVPPVPNNLPSAEELARETRPSTLFLKDVTSSQ